MIRRAVGYFISISPVCVWKHCLVDTHEHLMQCARSEPANSRMVGLCEKVDVSRKYLLPVICKAALNLPTVEPDL